MKLELNFSEDKEIRDYIKKIIDGQIRGIVREEFIKSTQEEINRKVEKNPILNSDYEMRGLLKQVISNNTKLNSYYGEKIIKETLLLLVIDYLKKMDIEKIIDTLVKSKTKEIIDSLYSKV